MRYCSVRLSNLIHFDTDVCTPAAVIYAVPAPGVTASFLLLEFIATCYAMRSLMCNLLQIHWPVSGNVGPEVVPSIQHTWRAMEQLVAEVHCLKCKTCMPGAVWLQSWSRAMCKHMQLSKHTVECLVALLHPF